MHAFDRRTDGQTEFPSLYRDCIPCSAVKIGPLHANDRNPLKCNVAPIVRLGRRFTRGRVSLDAASERVDFMIVVTNECPLLMLLMLLLMMMMTMAMT